MADKKISDLPAASSIGGTEILEATQSGSSVKVTVNELAAYGISKIILYHSGVDTTAVTGSTSNLISESVLIPANTFADGDRLRLNLRLVKVGTNNTYTPRIYVNTSASLSGATLLNALAGASNHEIFFIVNNWVFKSSSLMERVTASVPLPYDEGQGGFSLPPENFAFDTTVNQYLIFAIQNASSLDSTHYSDITIEKY
jgi:hypothetical protein